MYHNFGVSRRDVKLTHGLSKDPEVLKHSDHVYQSCLIFCFVSRYLRARVCDFHCRHEYFLYSRKNQGSHNDMLVQYDSPQSKEIPLTSRLQDEINQPCRAHSQRDEHDCSIRANKDEFAIGASFEFTVMDTQCVYCR